MDIARCEGSRSLSVWLKRSRAISLEELRKRERFAIGRTEFARICWPREASCVPTDMAECELPKGSGRKRDNKRWESRGMTACVCEDRRGGS